MNLKKCLLLLSILVLILGCQGGSDSEYVREQLGRGAVEQSSKKKGKKKKRTRNLSPGVVIDQLHGVPVYFNGGIGNTHGRHVAEDGYNLGLKWQCVEFVKRYYYDKLHHKMPDPWGHAKDFYDPYIIDGGYNTARNLRQFHNPSKTKPKKRDILVFKGHSDNPFGHIAIVSKVGKDYIEITQQNVGRDSRDRIPLIDMGNEWYLPNVDVSGWLGKRNRRRN